MEQGEGGRDEVFVAVFAAERDRVVRLAYAMVGDGEVAKDLAAEAFARTYEQWRRGRVDHLSAYVRQAVVNRARDHFRRAQRRRRHDRRRGDDDRGDAALAEGVARRDAARWLLDQLPVRQRAAVVLRYWADCTDVQIAEALGVPLGTAKSLLRRATLRMQHRLADLDDVAAGEPGPAGSDEEDRR